ncbi:MULTISPECIES: general secretion pathway protein GspB [unclassified Leclercia]|uniref:General secretion pathway protein GspB n=1 Tax=Leclercia barmai TaxID=2785629 RepID=A0ABS7RZ33_9ENTR|nr:MULTISPECIES: general secretion pathway protein GspB [unclassified Leclercia]MBZ0059566.1 general secretion pathway protein GspB [Leclercia sp. EMC7]MCM5697300.1 general secretion pathway protein GspB [Leclercia sp. LTM01]MCM5702103.1 general secretion pathway protein GspB [Leclercia sp. LTM14]
MSFTLSLPLRPHSRLSARLILALAGGCGVILALLAGAAISYGWHSLHNPPVVKKVEVTHSTQQPWRNLSPKVIFNVQPLTVETEEFVQEAEPEAEAPVADAESEHIADLAQLPDELRRRLPVIKYEAHIYSSETGRSVINLNGTDYSEGAEISGGVRVEKIEPDSAIFAYDGHLFRVAALADW